MLRIGKVQQMFNDFEKDDNVDDECAIESGTETSQNYNLKNSKSRSSKHEQTGLRTSSRNTYEGVTNTNANLREFHGSAIVSI